MDPPSPCHVSAHRFFFFFFCQSAENELFMREFCPVDLASGGGRSNDSLWMTTVGRSSAAPQKTITNPFYLLSYSSMLLSMRSEVTRTRTHSVWISFWIILSVFFSPPHSWWGKGGGGGGGGGGIELQMSGVAITSAEKEEGGGRTGRGDGRTRLKPYLLVKNERLLYKTVCLLTF